MRLSIIFLIFRGLWPPLVATVGVGIVNPPPSLLLLSPAPPPVLSPALQLLGQTVAVMNSLVDGARLGPSQYGRGWPHISLCLQVGVLQPLPSPLPSQSWTGETRLLEKVVGTSVSPSRLPSMERRGTVQDQVVQTSVFSCEERLVIIVSALILFTE